MQVCQNYTSSEMLDECDQYVKQNSPNTWPNDSNAVQYTNCDENDQPSMSERATNVGDRKTTGPVVTDDDLTCAECVENNYWMDNKVAKSLNDKPGSDHKKKKATFHTDSSLLTFHHLYPSSHDQIDSKSIDYKTFNSDIDLNLKSIDATKPYYRDIQCHRNDDNYRQPNQDIGCKSFNIDYSQYNSSNSNCHIDCIRTDFYNHDCLMNDVDCNKIPNSIDCNNRYPEYERRNVFYDKESKEERAALHKRRQETDQIMLDQLARILAILERNPT
ncbi:uncharacterized protein LOC119190728 [Manduca sexta]|uniref:uncharacterized protein LOC119190728 n=1 Tax=Manduca sexta TaxID=7130 RepID=UPI00188E3908|nr:uncharacterized protein LOC119190728 [Manduca sexta]